MKIFKEEDHYGKKWLNMGDLSPAETSTAVKVPPADPTFEKISLGELSAVSAEPPEIWKKGGRLLSGMLGINIVLLGCGLVSSGAFTAVSVAEREVLSFLSVLMGLTSIWMVSYLLWTSKHKNNPKLKDSHAGPIWLRGGLVLFGVCSLVLDILKIGKSVTLIHCESPVKIAHPVIQVVFVVIQTYFLWVSCQDCAQIHMNLTRCGLMITLSTNLAIWMAAVTDESLHQTHELITGVNHTSNATTGVRAAGGGSHGCDCVTQLCKTFQNGYYYLYPFNIEYSLFASAMSYVMWKNVGRVTSEHHHHTQHKFKTRNLFVGLLCGIGVLVAGLGVFIIYKIEVDIEDSKSQAITMFYIFNITALSLMSIGSLAGTIIYRFDKRDMDNHKNPTRTLDVVLLLGAALGQYCISYFSIVAMIAMQPGEQLHTLILVNALLLIVQHTLQNTFIIEGLHRHPHTNNHHPAELQEKDLSPHVYINPAATDSHSNHSPSSNGKHEYELETKHNRTPTIFPENSKTDWRRKILKEISLFLLVSNIIFWIIPAFGARPQFDNGLELQFYGDNMWVVIVNIGLPFGIFYRMHSVASLVEVYIMT
ncbi:proton channel OTOP2 isoform X1 [Xenopus laevis]|uniref:Proton channel OTOP2 isoform X1 n=1 Tax=Xenopus laevis TaxID=8355 RepID=A0A8J1LT12_XENLA|nr:proton channel OTOP2 isoform X1 [Xenopus laevis]